jgi:antitoxin MazE
MASKVSADQTVQEWGNGLGVRIIAPVAKAARLARGTPIRVEVVEGGFFVRVSGKPKLVLAQKLKGFDPAKHREELMVTGPVGVEAVADGSS